MSKRDELLEFYNEIKECTHCELGLTRTNFVFGSGNPSAALVFVGEAPGKQEDLRGKPFVGAAGKLLESLLETIGLTRSDVFIANVLKCRPPGNRDPKPEEISTCRPHLEKQLEIISPKVVCTLGNFSTKLLLDSAEGISKLHGQCVPAGEFTIIPSYHPAAALYTPSLRSSLEEDFKAVLATLSVEKVELGQVNGDKTDPPKLRLF